MSKVVIITGASSGIGYATAEYLHDQGYIVYASSRSMEDMKLLAKKGIKTVIIDVTNKDQIREVFKSIYQKEGTIDVLFANAGFGVTGSVETTNLDLVKREFDTNVFGMIDSIRCALPYMRKQGSGKIIVNTSITAIIALPIMSWYSASKYALEACCDGLRLEVKDQGIQVVKVRCGFIQTPFSKLCFSTLEESLGTEHGEVYRDMSEIFKHNYLTYEKRYGAPPQLVAKKIGKIIQHRKPRKRYQVNTISHQVYYAKRVLGTFTQDYLINFLFTKKKKNRYTKLY